MPQSPLKNGDSEETQSILSQSFFSIFVKTKPLINQNMKKLILFLLFSLKIFAQSTEDKIKALIPELDAKFQDFKVKSHLSSVAYALVLDGKIIYQSNSGIVNYKTKKKRW